MVGAIKAFGPSERQVEHRAAHPGRRIRKAAVIQPVIKYNLQIEPTYTFPALVRLNQHEQRMLRVNSPLVLIRAPPHRRRRRDCSREVGRSLLPRTVAQYRGRRCPVHDVAT